MTNLEKIKSDIMQKLENIYTVSNQKTGGILEILKDAFQHFGDVNGKEAAAGMAYYTLFSLFPLLLALVSIGSFLLNRQQVFNQIVALINNTIPVSQQLIEDNLQKVLELRGTVGLIGLLTVVWSGSGAFTILSRNINRAWVDTKSRNFLKSRLLALGMVGIITLSLVVSLFASVILEIFGRFEVALINLESIYNTVAWTVLSEVIPWGIIFCLILALYRWVPNTEVLWSSAIGGALPVTIAWILVTRSFTWVLSQGIIRYRIVYGSLSTLIALLFWIYLSSWLIIFGAHLCSAISRQA